MVKNNKKVLLLGDFSINEIHHSNLTKIAQDAPIPIFDIINTEKFLGSAGIILEKFSMLGNKDIIPIGIVGDDISGDWIKEKIKELKINNSKILKVKRKTPNISRILVDNVQTTRFDNISNEELTNTHTQKIIKIITKELKTVGLVIIADYGFGTINEKITKHVIQESKKINLDVLVTSNEDSYLMYKGSNVIIKINLENAALLIKEPKISSISPNKIISKISQILESNRILLTQGTEGITIFDSKNITSMAATENKKVDIKGIGEMMIAIISMNFAKTHKFDESCELGNIAAGVAISKNSTESVSLNDIQKGKKEYYKWTDEK